ncbi:MAG: TfoX/Sxy family protein [Longimicrobiales bacterium]
MPVSPDFRTFVLEQLARVAPGVRSRSMFGGIGIYSQNLFFALIDNDTLYFKVDNSNRPDFEDLGLGPFRPFGEGGEIMQYYEIPAGIIDDVDALQPWVDKAIDVAARKKRG